MTIDQIIALSSSIGGCMSAVAAFFAVRQNTKQREASYKPELVVTRTTIVAGKNPISASSFAELWIEKRDVANDSENPDLKVHSLLSTFSLPIHNVGLGAAKEVNLKWSFAIEEIVKSINDKTQKLLVPAYFEFKNEILSFNSQVYSASASMWRNQKHMLLDFVLPVSIDQKGVKAVVPPAYIKLVAALIYFSAKDKGSNAFADPPPLKLDIEYSDIGGSKHSTSLTIELNLITIGAEGESFLGYMQSKKTEK